MEFNELVKTRQSCRSYDENRQVEDEKLSACIAAAKAAPSAMNAQPYDMWVIRSPDAVQKMRAARSSFNKFFDECSTFVVYTDASYGNERLDGLAGATGIDYRTMDIGESIAYFTLQAAALGLGTCIAGAFDAEGVKALIGTDAHIQAILAVGYPKEGYEIREKVRKPLEENVHFL